MCRRASAWRNSNCVRRVSTLAPMTQKGVEHLEQAELARAALMNREHD